MPMLRLSLRLLRSPALCAKTSSRHAKFNPAARALSLLAHPASARPQCETYFTLSAQPSLRKLDTRFFASNLSVPASAATTASAEHEQAHEDTAEPPPLTPPAVGRWLLSSAVLVVGVIVAGGVTRLTESGLSITEWKPLTGVLPPLTAAAWQAELDKYRETPEFKLLNSRITMDEFKRIWLMEYAHRLLGRAVGVAFAVPLLYFALRRRLAPPLPLQLGALGVLLGAQGALGWYMVRSGLDDALMDDPRAVPRVSQYRLAAHLGAAVVLYAGMFASGLAIVRDWRFAHGGDVARSVGMVGRKFRVGAWALTALVFITALSGAFVAGLDAGLVYNEFPYMGDRIVPPTSELFDPAYAKRADRADLWWRSLFENPTTVQFDHRVLATSTYLGTAALYLSAVRGALPHAVRRAAGLAFGLANVQVLLGITTLLYLVPVPVAAAHQAGSVALLSGIIHVLIALRRPGAAARAWRKMLDARKNTRRI